MSVRIEHGDCMDVLPALLAEGVLVDSVICDPPYHLTSGNVVMDFTDGRPNGRRKTNKAGFMGKQWDGGDIAFRPETWTAVMAVMRPGAHLIAFSGTRTYHRMVCAIEDAGFEIRDQIGWAFGSGFPKSHNVSKGIDRAAGAERGRSRDVRNGPNTRQETKGQPRIVGGYASDAPLDSGPATDDARKWDGWGSALKPAWEPIVLARKPLAKGHTIAANVLAHGVGGLNIDACRIGTDVTTTLRNGNSGGEKFGRDERVGAWDNPPGRFPANLIHDGSDEVIAAFPQTATGAWNGNRPGTEPNTIYGAFNPIDGQPRAADSGSAARFFYSSKADAADRCGSKHPTVKPTDLMAYLCRLVTPPGGLVLDPFAGSGSTGMACLREGFDAILIEREAEYVADIRRRLAHVSGGGTPLFGEAA